MFAVWWWDGAFNDRGYQPPQPIPYSHKLHAGLGEGELGIDCQYCHYNAERGKHAGVPPATVCLGCHSPDQGAVKSDGELISSLLAMLNVEDPSHIYADGDDLDGRDEGTAKAGGVPHWNRIHLLPDHVYFRHEVHVKAWCCLPDLPRPHSRNGSRRSARAPNRGLVHGVPPRR